MGNRHPLSRSSKSVRRDGYSLLPPVVSKAFCPYNAPYDAAGRRLFDQDCRRESYAEFDASSD
jgi:hypothetical protein